MQRIDAHQHFWEFDPERHDWINEDMALLRRDFQPDELFPLLKENNFDGCVAVQVDQTETETHYLLKLASTFKWIKGVVGWVDLRNEMVEERLRYFSSFELLKGFRHIVQSEPRKDFLLGNDFRRGIALLHQYGFTYDILVFPEHLTFVREFIQQFPHQPFVIDHLAKPHIRTGRIEEWKKDMEAIARYPNVYCKLSGLVTEADWKSWQMEDIAPYLDVVVHAFGTDRVMFGSDWPVCLTAASYSEVVGLIDNYFSSFSRQEKEKVYGLNAIGFYKLSM